LTRSVNRQLFTDVPMYRVGLHRLSNQLPISDGWLSFGRDVVWNLGGSNARRPTSHLVSINLHIQSSRFHDDDESL